MEKEEEAGNVAELGRVKPWGRSPASRVWEGTPAMTGLVSWRRGSGTQSYPQIYSHFKGQPQGHETSPPKR